MKAAAQRIALVVGGLIVALAMLEGAVRIISPAPPLMFVPDATLGWVHPRNAAFEYRGNSGTIDVRFNAKGLRGPAYPYEKARGAYRILVLGDSYAEAADVASGDMFTSRLEAGFRRSGCHAEVINGGVGGYGTDQAALFLRTEGWSYSPDLVLLAFTLDNDVHDNVSKGYCRLTTDGVICAPPDRTGARQMLTSFKAFLQAHLHAYFFIQQKTQQMPALRVILERLHLTEYRDARVQAEDSIDMPLSLFLRHERRDVSQGWMLTLGILESLVRDTRRREVDFAMVVVPAVIQLDARAFSEAIGAAGLPASDFDLMRPDRILADFGKSQSIPVLSVLEDFRARQARGEQLMQGHWNARGHAVAASALQDMLTRNIAGLARCRATAEGTW